MKRNGIKRLLALSAATILALTALAGCGGSASTSEAPKEEAAAEEEAPAEETAEAPAEEAPAEEAPAEEGGHANHITLAIQESGRVKDYDTNYLTKYLEEQLDCDIEFQFLSEEDGPTKIALMAADGNNLPDIIFFPEAFTESGYEYGQQGFLVPWDEYIGTDLMPNYNALPQDVKDRIYQNLVEADGHMYNLPKHDVNWWNTSPWRPFINVDWLEKLGLEVPTTTEELKEVLIAFRDQDPNGNGIQDEIPLTGNFERDSYGRNVIYGLINCFTFFNGFDENVGLAVADDGKTIYAPWTTDEWRQALAYMADLYAEGLLTSEVFTNTDEAIKATLNNDPNIVGMIYTGTLGGWTDRATNPNMGQMDLIKPVSGRADGRSFSCMNTGKVYTMGGIVNGPNVEFAVKFFDMFMNWTTIEVSEYGEEGVHWTEDPDELAKWSEAGGALDWIDYGFVDDIVLLVYDMDGGDNNETWDGVHPSYWTDASQIATGSMPEEGVDPRADFTYGIRPKNTTRNAQWPDYLLGRIVYTPEEREAISEYRVSIPEYVDKCMVDFITGARPLDDWDAYVEEVNNMGQEEWTRISQEAFDRLPITITKESSGWQWTGTNSKDIE